ncbi:MAG: endolytic transglycosylase MltG [Chthonomonadales bacterium]|nr:endolytic transglycosylase MltG [Chthonomonadales bacterium]
MASRRRIRRWVIWYALVEALVIVAGLIAWFWFQKQLTPVGQGPARVVWIARGSEIRGVSRRLRAMGLIRHADAFRWYARWRGDTERIKAGRYRLSPTMTAGQILDRLTSGKQDTEGLVVIPEGFTLRRIAERLVARGILRDGKAFLDLARNPQGRIRTGFAAPASGLEGYLFPSSYDIEPGTKPERIIQMMVDQFEEQFARPYADEIARRGRNLHEIVTIASMIEREAEVEKDRPLIAGVIENRLRKGMRLQIDATVLYALGQHKSRVLYRDLQVASPYNTYRNAGLPPGPIASPGLPSLLAALRPATHDYLFYVALGDGSHVFTRTEAEHNREVARYRARQRSGGN